MVYRIYVEKRPELAHQAHALLATVHQQLGFADVRSVRVLNRYDVEGISAAVFAACIPTVFSEPPVDRVFATLSDALKLNECVNTADFQHDEVPSVGADQAVFAVEYLPGQFDQRADSAMQCIAMAHPGAQAIVRSATVYLIDGVGDDAARAAITQHVVNPVESREASLAMPDTLDQRHADPQPVPRLDGFTDLTEDDLSAFRSRLGLAMDDADLLVCQQYFRGEHRDPTMTEIRMIDTYWSDHCRHTTFNTIIDSVHCDDPLLEATYNDYVATRAELGRSTEDGKPVTLMDLGTIVAKYLRKNGRLDRLDASEEINACTVKVDVDIDGETQPWLLLFKNETHNHPTEIEPFGGAATCIGGAIRDPLSGRAYVYGAMRVTGAGDPRQPFPETLAGKLPQRTIVQRARDGYSSYGNQIGLATGVVDEIYHPGYIAKRMEIGAVIGAVPEALVRRETPAEGDVVVLLGGRTGRDGIGGATGSSKAHTVHSVDVAGAEVQKGNAPEERKLQRFFRNPDAVRMIKRCNDFGAGGVSVAIGELADGLAINLDAVPKKYAGLDGTELAISESQERMAIVIDPDDTDRLMQIADDENLEATVVARVTGDSRLTMEWAGQRVVDVSRAFLNTNGAEKHTSVRMHRPAFDGRARGNAATGELVSLPASAEFADVMASLLSDPAIASHQGLTETFDSTIGAGTVLMPFGGIYQRTPAQSLVQKVSVERGDTSTCSLMAYGFNPWISQASPFHGAYLAVVESVAKLVANGAHVSDVYLSFQEFFGRPGSDPERWGQPMAALLGAFRAQKDLGIAAIGGKDSMSGTFEQLDVPPTLVSFAVTTEPIGAIRSAEFKQAGHRLVYLAPRVGDDGLPEADAVLATFARVGELFDSGLAVSGWAIGAGGVAEAAFKMAIGNEIGYRFDAESVPLTQLTEAAYGAFLLEMSDTDADDDPRTRTASAGVTERMIGRTLADPVACYGQQTLDLAQQLRRYNQPLESVYPMGVSAESTGDHAECPDQPERLSVPGLGSVPTLHSAPAPDSAPTLDSRDDDRAQAAESPRAQRTAPAIPESVRPVVLIPVFPGTNTEYDAAKFVECSGAQARIFVVNTRSADRVARSVTEFATQIDSANVVFLPGGFSGGDEPDGSAKFVTNFLRNAEIRDALTRMMDQRDGLMLGICNGFQALVKLGLVPYGTIVDPRPSMPTLTFNTIGRHQSKLVRTRIVANTSPWLTYTSVGDVYTVPISHGEGRFIATDDELKALIENGQIATQYAGVDGNATMDISGNPNGSFLGVEGITSPDGRIFGKMGHVERVGKGLYMNVPGNDDPRLMESAVAFFHAV
ncbi:MAG: phosphoribosylformylglycinamidine synthase [Actinomycetaceae bacterium]|nr:phosphoribosylformylglycinamidine synthase [Actinomycetaceae bacterium]MDY6083349.1 phosphoribosylformylglycinamidine synthase [Actinomycetaceae bacterium]